MPVIYHPVSLQVFSTIVYSNYAAKYVSANCLTTSAHTQTCAAENQPAIFRYIYIITSVHVQSYVAKCGLAISSQVFTLTLVLQNVGVLLQNVGLSSYLITCAYTQNNLAEYGPSIYPITCAHTLSYCAKCEPAICLIMQVHTQELYCRLWGAHSHKHVAEYVPGLPTIYLITPTHARTEQKADLVRLSHTLLHIHNIHWIVIEDSDIKTPLVTNFLNTCGLNYTHLNVKTPPEVQCEWVACNNPE